MDTNPNIELTNDIHNINKNDYSVQPDNSNDLFSDNLVEIGLLDNSSYILLSTLLSKFIENNKDNNQMFNFNFVYYFIKKNTIYESTTKDILTVIEEYDKLDKENEILEEDPWEVSINDNKFYINNRIARIFPQMKNFSNYGKLKIDDDSFSYITIREIAEIISKIISHHLLQFNINPQKTTIVDYTSGVGGNVLSFSKYFQNVYAVELSTLRAEYLKNNINVYGFKNINVINESAIDYNANSMIKENPNVIFVDPPWGGSDYKNIEMLTLNLGQVPIENLVLDIVERFSEYYRNLLSNVTDQIERQKISLNNFNNKLIVFKLPKNYNIEHFYKFIKNINSKYYVLKTYLYILNKMLIVIVELYFIGM